MGWEKNEVQIADLEEHGANDCEVCEMLINGLRSYRDMVNPQIPLPSSVSVQCVPGRSFIIKPAEVTPSGNNSTSIKLALSTGDSAPQGKPTQDFLEPDGLEFFITPGELVPSKSSKYHFEC
jgi:hypothetical protein